MKKNKFQKISVISFILIFLFLVAMAWFASQPGTKGAFDAVHRFHVFGFDDFYRFFLSSDPLRCLDLWFWSYYLPGAIVVDGFLSWVSMHNQFFMRVIHILFNMVGIVFIYRAGLLLNIQRKWLFLSLITLLLMPFNMLLSMSFYAESLLAPLLSIVAYLLVARKNKWLAVVAPLMPFFRPEGAFYLGFIFLFKLVKKKFKLALFLVIPPLLYALAILIFFDWNLSKYYDWRVVFIEINDLIPFHKDWLQNVVERFYLINFFWWILGFSGIFFSKMRPLRPLLYGSISVVVFYVIAGVLYTRNETRYLFPMFPLLALSQAAALSAVIERICVDRRKWAASLCAILMLLIFLENILQIDPVREKYFDGRRWPVSLRTPAIKFTVLNNDLLVESNNQIANFTYAYTNYDKSIDRIIVTPFFIYNTLDGRKYRDGVEVDAETVNSDLVHKYTDGYFFALRPEYPQYGLYRLYPADKKLDFTPDGNALFVDYVNQSPFADPSIKPIFHNKMYRVYRVQYRAFKVVR